MRVPASGKPAEPGREHAPTPTAETHPDGQAKDHWVLSDEERAKGFIRPVRRAYKHLKCGAVTTMPQKIAETYASKPSFYGSTFCCSCKGYFPVGADGEFVWEGDYSSKVGT